MAAMVQKVAPSSEFGFGFVLGEGAFAHVIHARRKSDKRDFAVKVMLKSHAEREGKTRAVLAESMALQRCAKCAFVVGLERTFQDDDYLFFVLEFASGGDLLGAIKRGAKRHAAFYAAEIWLGLEFLQDVGLAHRDLKPENVLLDSKGHVKIADFGSVLDTRQPSLRKPPAQNETRQPSLRRRPSEARPSELRQPALQRRPSSLGEAVPEERQSEDRRSFFDDERHGSFEGTAEYVSPEVLTGETTTCACDLWALGCIIFQLCTSKPPFTAPTDYLLWEMIIAFAEGRDDAALDVSGLDEDAEAMIRALLVKNGLMRLGASLESRGAFCGHAFFDQTDWPGLRLFPPTVEAPLQQVEAARVPDDGFHDFSMEFMLGLDIAGAGDSVRIVEPIRRPKEVDTFFSSMSPRSQGRTRAALERYDWAARLDVDETLVCARVVWKRKGLLWRERVFLLTSKPRLVYYDATAADVDGRELPNCRGQIAWTYAAPVHCRRRSSHHFDVVTEDRDYHLASFDEGSDVWIDRIEATLTKQAQRQFDIRKKLSQRGSSVTSSNTDDDFAPDSPDALPGEAPMVQGFLWKQGKIHAIHAVSPSPSFKRRYAVLRGIQLFYYRDRPSSKSRAPLGVVRCVAAQATTGAAGRWAFDVLALGGRTLKCYVDSEQDRARWVAGLSAAIGLAANCS